MKTPKITIENAHVEILDPLVNAFPDRNFQNFARYLQQAQRDECAFLVTLIDDNVIGYCLIYWQSEFKGFQYHNAPEIVDLIVAPPYRRQGIARILLDEIENIALNRGAKNIGLTVLQSNTTAHHLYQNRGFKEIERTNITNSQDTNLMLLKDLLT